LVTKQKDPLIRKAVAEICAMISVVSKTTQCDTMVTLSNLQTNWNTQNSNM